MRRLGLGSMQWLVMGALFGMAPMVGMAQQTGSASDSVNRAKILDTSTPDAYFGVTLSAEQRTQLLAIRGQYTPRLKAIVAQGQAKALSRDSVRVRLQRITTQRQADMMAVLTPEQRVTAAATFTARKAAVVERRRKRSEAQRRQGRGGAR